MDIIMKRGVLTCFLLSLLIGTDNNSQSWPTGIHDPSKIVKCDSNYWIFGTGEGILAKSSSDMLSWSDTTSPFPGGDFPQWILNYAKTATDQFDGFFWAPDIIYMNNQYYLYYSASVWGTMNSCIGVVLNKTLNPGDPDYEWVDQGDIGIYSNGGYVNAIDPAVMRGPEGKIWMVYGSFNRDGIILTEIDSVTGKPIGLRTSIANSYTGGGIYFEGEGASLIYRDGYYYLFYNKGGCCNGIASSYYIVMGRSENPRGPYIDKDGKNMRVIGAASGGTVVLRHDDNRGLQDRYYGPGHFSLYSEKGKDYVTFHYYDPNGYYPSAEASYRGGPTLGLALLKWGDDGWPYISLDFLEEGLYTFQNANSGKMMDVFEHNTTGNAALYQYPSDTGLSTQTWHMLPLGTGEYLMRNYADMTKYVEGIFSNLRLNSDYEGDIKGKFRIVKSPGDQVLIYPSIQDQVMEVPNAATADINIRLFSFTNHACQRWIADPVSMLLSVSHQSLAFNNTVTSFDQLSVICEESWTLQVEDTSWLTVKPDSGSGNQTLEVFVDPNLTENERTNKLVIESLSGITREVSISQLSGPALFSSIPEIEKIMVYPNPAENSIRIRCSHSLDLEIMNTTGKQVKSVAGYEHEEPVDMSQLPAGIYFVRLSDRTGSVIRKIIKQ